MSSAEPKQKPSETNSVNPKKKPPIETTEKSSITSFPPEVKKLSGEEAKAKTEAEKAATRARSVVKLDVLKGGPDQAEAITGLPEYPSAKEIVDKKLIPEQPKKASSAVEKCWEWIKEHPYQTAIYATAAAVGVYTIYSIFESDHSADKDKNGKEKSWLSKKEIFGLLLSLGGILGAYNYEKIRDFITKIVDISEEKWDKFVANIKAGNYLEAIKCLFEGSDSHYQYYKQLAEKISTESGKQLSAKTIQQIANAKYSDFISPVSRGTSYALGKAKDIPGVGKLVSAFADSKQAEEEQILREYLQKHPEKIPKGEKTTVFEALTAAADISPLSSLAPEKQKPMIDGVDTGNGNAIGVNHEIANKMRENFKNKPHLKAFFDKYAQNWHEAVLKSHNFWKELLEACHLDQVGLVLADNKVILVDGDNIFCITDSPALYKTAQDVVNAGPAADTVGWSNSVQNIVFEGIGTCVVVGAGLGGVKSLLTKGESAIWGAIKGGGRGLLFPLKAVNPYNLQTMYRGVRGTEFSIKKAFAGDAAKIEILRNEAKFHAEIGEKYHELLREGESGKFFNTKKWYAQFGSKRIEKMRDKHVRLFADAYNELQKRQGAPQGSAKTLETIEGKSKSIPKETIDEMGKFLVETHRHELDTLERMGKSLVDPLEKTQFEKLPDASSKIKALGEASDRAERYMEDVLAKTREMQKAGKPEAEIEKFQREAESNFKKVREDYNGAFAHLKSLEKDMVPAEKKALQELIETKLTKARGVRGILKEMKGRAKFALVFGVAHVVWDIYHVSKKEKEEHVKQELINIVKEIGLDTLQLVLDIFSPFGVSDWYTVISGKEILTGKKADTWDRLTRVVFGTYNLATDTLAAIGGAATAEVGGAGGAGIYAAENVVEASIRTAGKGPEVYRAVKTVLPRITALAKNSGGYRNLLKIIKNPTTIKTLQKVKKVSGAAQTGLLGLELAKAAYAGYHIVFDTKDQPEHIVEMASALPSENK